MIDEQSSATGHDYASDHTAIGAGRCIEWTMADKNPKITLLYFIIYHIIYSICIHINRSIIIIN